MKNKRNQVGMAGIFLIELLVCMSIVLALAATTTVNMAKAQAGKNFVAAKNRLRLVSDAITAEAICNQTPSCVVSPAVMNIIPNPGSLLQSGYLFSLVNNGSGSWSYTAIPVRDGFTGAGSVMVGPDGILRCEPIGSSVTATSTSRACQ